MRLTKAPRSRRWLFHIPLYGLFRSVFVTEWAGTGTFGFDGPKTDDLERLRQAIGQGVAGHLSGGMEIQALHDGGTMEFGGSHRDV